MIIIDIFDIFRDDVGSAWPQRQLQTAIDCCACHGASYESELAPDPLRIWYGCVEAVQWYGYMWRYVCWRSGFAVQPGADRAAGQALSLCDGASHGQASE